MKGFTLVELLVSISIFTVITTVAVFNNAQFNGSVLLTNLAYEIALSIRQAQSYGISVRRNIVSSFDSGYGIHFNASNPTQYILFEDKILSGIPHAKDAGDIEVQTFTIFKGNKIAKVCFNGTIPCNPGTESGISDITFIRPNPDSYIRSNGISYNKAEICVTSPQGIIRKITVEVTGQISVSVDNSGVCN